MKGTSHFITGTVVSFIVVGEVSGLNKFTELLPFGIIGGLSSLLPDLDAERSFIKYLEVKISKKSWRPFYLISKLINTSFGHRKMWHSLLAIIILFFIASPIWFFGYFNIYISILCGYTTHLLMDSLTKLGIPFLYPNKYYFKILPSEFRITTGGFGEYIIVGVLCIAFIMWYFINSQIVI